MIKVTNPIAARALCRYYSALSWKIIYHHTLCTYIELLYGNWYANRSITQDDIDELMDDPEFVRMLVEEELSDG